MRSWLPKVYYVFYEYFFKAVVGEGTWKHRFAKGERLGTNVLEAYALAIIKNNYFAWLYDYKSNNPASTLQTEYDLAEEHTSEFDKEDDEEEEEEPQGEADDEEEPQGEADDEKKTFCGDLDELEIANPQMDDHSGFHLVVDGDQEYKEMQKITRQARKTIIRSDGFRRNKDSNDKVTAMLTRDTSDTSDYSSSPSDSRSVLAKERTKKRRKSMRELKTYTGGSARKKRKKTKDKDGYKGWSQEGRAFMVMHTKEIKEDVESGKHGEWEKMYKRICAAVKKSDEDQDAGGDDGEDADYSVLYHCEV